MNKTAQRVLEETIRFEQALPELRQTLEGRWVVFKDGEVCSHHADEAAAYQAGLDMFGAQGGHVVAKVEEQVVQPLRAAVLYS